MNISIKISNINDAPNIAMGWADAVVSIYEPESISQPTYKEEIKHHVMIIDEVDDKNNNLMIIDDANLGLFIQFIKELKSESKLLIHSRTGDKRASTLVYIYFMIHDISPASALYKLKEINNNANPILDVIKSVEKYLKIDNKYSLFIDVWKRTNIIDIT